MADDQGKWTHKETEEVAKEQADKRSKNSKAQEERRKESKRLEDPNAKRSRFDWR